MSSVLGSWNPLHTGGRKQGIRWFQHLPHADPWCEDAMGFNPPNASYAVSTICSSFSAYSCQGEHSTIMILLTRLYQETRIFIPLNSVMLTGRPLDLSLHGWNHFDPQPQRCLPQKYWCFQQHMQFSKAYKTTSRTLSMISPTWHHKISNLVLQMHTTSSATITISSMHLPSTPGLHVSGFLPKWFISDFILPTSAWSTDLIWGHEGGLCWQSNAVHSPWRIKVKPL